MKYERPELLVVMLNMEDVVACSTQENWGTGEGEELGPFYPVNN